MAIDHFFAGVAAADYKQALGWYERLLGRPPDVIVKDDEAMWQVTEAAWIYVVGDSDRAGKALLTILVDDLDEQVAELNERDIPTGPIDTVPGAVRRVAITDPEGNRITFGQALTAGD
jgi:catechol 2,3-dioxygenase-like lactoylglutathione lyase family enzyme